MVVEFSVKETVETVNRGPASDVVAVTVTVEVVLAHDTDLLNVTVDERISPESV